MAEATLVIRMTSEAAEEHAAELDKLEKRLESHGAAQWAGTLDMGGTDFIVWLDVDVFDDDDLPDRISEIEAHVAEVGLRGIARVEIPQDADDDWDEEDDEDDDGDEDDDDVAEDDERPADDRPDDEYPDEPPDDETPDEYPDDETPDEEDPDGEYPDDDEEVGE